MCWNGSSSESFSQHAEVQQTYLCLHEEGQQHAPRQRLWSLQLAIVHR
jgi:hypothetical protein